MTGPDRGGEAFAPKRRSDVAAAEVDGEVVLYDERSGELHVLNPTAGLVWARCDGTASLADMIDELAAAFSVDRRRVAHDVMAVVRHLDGLGLLEEPSSPSAPSGGRLGSDEDRPDDGDLDEHGGESPFSAVPPSP